MVVDGYLGKIPLTNFGDENLSEICYNITNLHLSSTTCHLATWLNYAFSKKKIRQNLPQFKFSILLGINLKLAPFMGMS